MANLNISRWIPEGRKPTARLISDHEESHGGGRFSQLTTRLSSYEILMM